jgi:serine/threonine protein kinase
MGPAQAPAVQRLGRYEVIRHLASGGMAEIYLARDTAPPSWARGSEQVVMKVISRDRSHDKKFIQMFLDEARVAATLHHPHIAGMLEVGLQDDTYFLAMEYVDGDTVRALLERAVTTSKRIPLPVCVHIAAAVAAGLHHAHERKGATGEVLQIVHRDVTPSNIMLSWDGEVKLLDFGIAQANNRALETQSGTIKGKFAYMSPEQCRGKVVDRRTDVFALGIVLYELTTQRRAFRTENDFETMDRIVKGKLAQPSSFDPTYPLELEAIVMKALATEVEDRYPSAEALRHALADYATRRGGVATAADVAVCMHDVFRSGGLGDTLVDATNSDVDLDVEMSDSLDAGTTVPRLDAAQAAALAAEVARSPRGAAATAARAAEPSPLAAEDGLSPAMTGPMPVMPPSRPSGAVEVPRVAPMMTGPLPQLDLATTTGPHTAPGHTGPQPRIPIDEWNAPVKTILGTAPAIVRPPTTTGPQPALTDSGRRAVPSVVAPVAEAPVTPTPVPSTPAATPGKAAALDTVALPPEPAHLVRRQRRGLTLALVAIVIVAVVVAVAVVLGGRARDRDRAEPPVPAPTAPR